MHPIEHLLSCMVMARDMYVTTAVRVSRWSAPIR